MRYYIIAGERSGDLHGSNLIAELRKRDPGAKIRCWGGEMMKNAGGELAMDYRNTAYMGIWETLVNFPAIFRNLRFCKKDILAFKPDALILIDYPGFNLRIARFAKRKGLKTIYYISPKIWAWNTGRVKTIKANVDLMLAVLPFEPQFYKKYGMDVEYVGNPVYDAVKAHKADTDFFEKNNLPDDKEIVALLPGSRAQEVKKVLPAMVETAMLFPTYHFVIAGVRNLDPGIYDVASRVENISIVYEQAYDLLAYSDAAIVTSGTATLETALWDVPQVAVYKTSAVTYLLAKMVVKVKFITLVNLIGGKEIVKELIQDDANAGEIGRELTGLMHDKERRSLMIQEYNRIKEKLGEEKASVRAARRIIAFVSGKR